MTAHLHLRQRFTTARPAIEWPSVYSVAFAASVGAAAGWIIGLIGAFL